MDPLIHLDIRVRPEVAVFAATGPRGTLFHLCRRGMCGGILGSGALCCNLWESVQAV